MRDLIFPAWEAPGVRAFVTTAAMGDMGGEALKKIVPSEPRWMHQVHGPRVIDADHTTTLVQADAAVARKPGTVCVVKIADCMPVLFAGDGVVAAAHAGWRGLASGVLEATIDAMRVAPRSLQAWMGPAIGPRIYEVGEDVHRAFPEHASAFEPNRPGHWLLDLYAVARRKLEAKGVAQISGGGFCTYTERERFFSYRRDRDSRRMAAVIYIESPTP